MQPPWPAELAGLVRSPVVGLVYENDVSRHLMGALDFRSGPSLGRRLLGGGYPSKITSLVPRGTLTAQSGRSSTAPAWQMAITCQRIGDGCGQAGRTLGQSRAPKKQTSRSISRNPTSVHHRHPATPDGDPCCSHPARHRQLRTKTRYTCDIDVHRGRTYCERCRRVPDEVPVRCRSDRHVSCTTTRCCLGNGSISSHV